VCNHKHALVCSPHRRTSIPKNKDSVLLHHHETCTCVAEAVTYQEDDDEVATGVAIVAAATVGPVGGAVGVGTATADIGVPNAAVGRTGVRWSLRTAAQPVATAARPSAAAAATRTDLSTAVWDATSTQGKTTFADAAVGIPDAAHASTQYQSTITSVAALPASATANAVADTTKTATATATTAAFSIHNNEDGVDDDWDLAPLVPITLGYAAAAGE
jgi:hypothetical protein